MHIYLSRPAVQVVERMIEPLLDKRRAAGLLHMFPRETVDYFSTFTAGELEVEAVAGSHDSWGENERSINYLIRFPHGPRVLCAWDTGYYRDDSWEYLSGRYAEVLIMDCTFGGSTTRDEYAYGHLHIVSFLHQLEKMAQIGFIDSQTRVFATHFNPHQGLNHEQMQQRFDHSDFTVTVAYDGLAIEV